MSEQNPNPDDEQPVFTKTEMNAIVQQRLQQDRARRGNPPPASSSSSTAAPAASGDDRLSRVEATLDRMATMFERFAPPAPSTTGAPQVTPTMEPAATSRPPAAAPAPPQTHTLPTAMGFPDIWNMTPEQFVQFRNSGQLRPTLEKMWEAGARQQGAPMRPSTPWSLDTAGNPVANPRYRGR